MKPLYFFLVLIFFGCGGSDDADPVKLPVATDDTVSVLENTPITINVLSNDVLTNNAELTNFDTASAKGGSIAEVYNKLIYTPANHFTGIDTFTYTICDGLSTPNCSTATVTVTVNDIGTPVAVNDTLEVVENTTTELTTILDNDTIVDDAILTSIDSSSSVGTITINDENVVTYTSLNGFSGEDTFTYTLCDSDSTPTCVTATVTITVLDEGNPVAVDDAYIVSINEVKIISDVLNNDQVIDDTVLTTLDATGTQGTVILNTEGTISYTPTTDFTGTDSFTYTVCDDDTPNNTCASATVTLTVTVPLNFNIPSDLVDYYTGVVFSEDSDLMFEELEAHTINNHTTILSYGQRHQHLYNADADLNNSDNVILIYTGESRYWEQYTSGSNPYSPQTYNTEHVYPQSLLDAANAVTDLHHLRACNSATNSERSNYPFEDGSGSYKLSANKWYPGDEWRGDIARMMMYLNIRYGETFESVGGLDLFVSWNVADPVSDFEIQRNNVIYAAQGNRNPFIDNPYLATLIWGGVAAENKWN